MIPRFKIVITGGSGRFGRILKKKFNKKNFFFPKKKELNILSLKSIEKYLKKKKPKIIIHLAGLSRPMMVHDKDISKSISLNIIGTANIVKICSKLNLKIVYFSTNYVYPGKKGNYKEIDPVLPINNYAWSKLGGEASVQMYKKSLILRVCMTEKPFLHSHAFYDFKNSFVFQEEIAEILPKLLKYQGILNVGGKSQTVFNFAKKYKNNVIPISRKKNKFFKNFPNTSISIEKIKNLI